MNKNRMQLWKWVLVILGLNGSLAIVCADEAAVEKWVTSIGGQVLRDDSRAGQPIWAVHLNTRATDADLKHLASFKNAFHLRGLSLSGSKVTDVGLKELAVFGGIENLSLQNTKITDAGVQELLRHNRIHSLNLSGTQITDQGLKELVKLPNLQLLGVRNTRVTAAAIQKLKAGLPKSCDVLR